MEWELSSVTPVCTKKNKKYTDPSSYHQVSLEASMTTAKCTENNVIHFIEHHNAQDTDRCRYKYILLKGTFRRDFAQGFKEIVTLAQPQTLLAFVPRLFLYLVICVSLKEMCILCNNINIFLKKI